MHGRRGHVPAARSGVKAEDSLIRSIFLDILSLELIQRCVSGLLQYLDIELCPLSCCPETIKLLNKLCAA